MAKKSTAPAPIADEAGQAWQGKADEAWAQATGRAEQLDDPDQPAILSTTHRRCPTSARARRST